MVDVQAPQNATETEMTKARAKAKAKTATTRKGPKAEKAKARTLSSEVVGYISIVWGVPSKVEGFVCGQGV